MARSSLIGLFNYFIHPRMSVTFVTKSGNSFVELQSMDQGLKAHWENIYKTRQPHQVSWTQDVPLISLELIRECHEAKNAPIIDVGGGDSKLVDHLLSDGYSDITVLDISSAALERAKSRLGSDAERVKWITSDILEFRPDRTYAIWHDRALLHFLLDTHSLETYCNTTRKAVEGSLIIGAFSTDGPDRCSNLQVHQFDETSLTRLFRPVGFESAGFRREDHFTPSGTLQRFIFGRFSRVK